MPHSHGTVEGRECVGLSARVSMLLFTSVGGKVLLALLEAGEAVPKRLDTRGKRTDRAPSLSCQRCSAGTLLGCLAHPGHPSQPKCPLGPPQGLHWEVMMTTQGHLLKELAWNTTENLEYIRISSYSQGWCFNCWIIPLPSPEIVLVWIGVREPIFEITATFLLHLQRVLQGEERGRIDVIHSFIPGLIY